ncbi:MAG: tetratricopeptide repeat protein [Acidobacteriota bacterium]
MGTVIAPRTGAVDLRTPWMRAAAEHIDPNPQRALPAQRARALWQPRTRALLSGLLLAGLLPAWVLLLGIGWTTPAAAQAPPAEAVSATSVEEVTEQIDTFQRLSEQNRHKNPELAISYAERGLALAERQLDAPRIADMAMQLGHALADRGKQNAALPNYLKALEHYRALDDFLGTTEALNAAGVAYYYMGFLHLSLEFHLEALAGREQLELEEKTAKSLNNIGLVYFGNGDYTEAVAFFERALDLKRKIGNQESVTKTLSNLGYAHFHLEEYEVALRYQTEALELSEAIDFDKGIAYALNLIGDIQRAMGKSQAARSTYQRSLELYRESGDQRGVVMVLNNLGAVHRDLGDLETAAKMLVEATIFGREIGAKLQLRDAFDLLAAVRVEQGKFADALDIYKRSVAYNDEILGEESQRQLAEMKVRYDSERRAQEIELLRRDNSIQEIELRRGSQRRTALAVALFLAALIAALLWVLYRQNRQTNARLAAKNQEAENARAAALEANQAKSLFLANMSHELRTPLTAIIGYSDLLIEDAEAAGETQTLRDLQNIRGSGKHLMTLINGVLDLSKIEAGKMTLSTTYFKIPALIESVVNTIQPLADKSRNRLVVEVPDGIGSMLADETKVRQTLFNLLSNACKFCRDGEVNLVVERRGTGEVSRIVFSVHDTGIGMSTDQLERAFDEFEQADSSTQRQFGGTGLGLPISRKFARMMGGEVTATSTLGEGSTFVLDLPARVEKPRLAS